MIVNKRILFAVDDSEASNQAVTYGAALLSGGKGFGVRLFQVLRPLPPGLLEFPGSENPQEEERLEAEKKAAQARWIEVAEKAAQPVFGKAKAIFRKAKLPTHVVETQLVPSESGQDVVTTILEEARRSQCGTVVVGRKSFSWLQELFRHHVGDELIRRGQGLTIWVVE